MATGIQFRFLIHEREVITLDNLLAAGRDTLLLCQANREPFTHTDGWDDRDQTPCCDFGGRENGLTTWGRS